jgi:peptidoglycan/LPS O-acetylase OafA/YrhL
LSCPFIQLIGEGLVNSGTSDFLSASRWVAAFFVVIFHVFNISVYYSGPQGLLFRCVHFLCGFGHIAVIVFFVISGFLVGGGSILRLENKGFDLIDYFIHRFARIYTVLLPALIACFMLDRLGITLFNGSEIYHLFYSNEFGDDLTIHLGLVTFIGNLLQLQMIAVSTFGSDGPLWSLANEWWYYVVFGFSMVAYHMRSMFTRVFAAFVSLAVVILLPPKISLWFVMWGIGAGAAVLDRCWAGWPFHFAATIALICLIAVRLASRYMDTENLDFILDLVVALGYSVALVSAKNHKGPQRFWTVNRRLASFSYSLYLVHFPVMVFVAAVFKDVFDISSARPPSVAALLYGAASMVFIYGFAWIFASATEAHTDTVKSRLSLAISDLRYRIHSRGSTRTS